MALVDVLDDVMEKLLFAKEERPGGPRSKAEYVNGKVFDDIDIMGEAFGSDRGFFTDVTPDVIWPCDQCMAVRKPASGLERPRLQVLRMRTARAPEMRGIARVIPRHLAWVYSGHFYDDGSVYKERRAVGWLGGGWAPIDTGIVFTAGVMPDGTRQEAGRIDAKRYSQEIADSCRMLHSGELTNRYEWSVSFRIDTSPSLKLFTDPSGIKALFKDRELGNRKRRAALRHWVTEHYRRSRRIEADAVWVREHLRGMERFSWCGYDCAVNVSAYDRERAEASRMRVA